MRSPFPGMDPYLEAHWLDVHTSLVAGARDALNGRLPGDLVASAEERVAVETESGGERLVGPDVKVFEPPASETAYLETPRGGVATAPFLLTAAAPLPEPVTERYVRVIEAGTERLVTVIEFVSPTNKRGDGLALFRGKRNELLAAGVNFVEVDLVREGDWEALLLPHRCPPQARSTYRATIRLPHESLHLYLYPFPLREKLPSIPIPLREKDPEVRLDLQELIDRAYVNGRYSRRLDYRRPCAPPLEGADAAAAAEILRAAGRG